MKDIYILDIFTSIQGEGRRVGTPSMFIRFKECNKSCSFCDTQELMKQNERLLTKEELWEKTTVNDIVFTGGEPMLYQESIKEIIEFLDTKDVFNYTIETNGTIKAEPYLLPKNILWSISLKISTKQPLLAQLENIPIGSLQIKVVTNKEVIFNNLLRPLSTLLKRHYIIFQLLDKNGSYKRDRPKVGYSFFKAIAKRFKLERYLVIPQVHKFMGWK